MRELPPSPAAQLRRSLAAALAIVLLGPGCMVGPHYRAPAAPAAGRWLEADDPRVRSDVGADPAWWTAFHDPVLERLVESAHVRNPTLEAAGLRVIQALARRGIAIGNLYPQTQEAIGSYGHTVLGPNATVAAAAAAGAGGVRGGSLEFDSWQLGFDTAWEVDLWGRFRRGIEAADADLLASLASYDDVLVSLCAQVASVYLQARVLEERIAIARDNVKTQQDSLDIARIRFEAGGTSNLDVQQALTLVRDTEATIPQLEAQLRQATDLLSILLGLPPQAIDDLVGPPGRIPEPPATVAVGIPADLIERRPDVRAAERAAAAQSARIGVAFADLLPRVDLVGTVGLRADDAARLLEGRSFAASAGPQFEWPILNYGRIVNNVRLQDATFQERLTDYTNVVLGAQREVEDALTGYVNGLDQVSRLREAVAAATRAVDLSTVQYREGAADYTRVLNSQQQLLHEADLLVQTRGEVALSVVSLYRAVGGGWELREGGDLVPPATLQAMRARTWYGSLLAGDRPARDVAEARHGTERSRWWTWRAWWPRW